MESQEKNELLAKLYTLRAGLSTLAMENGKAEEMKAQCARKIVEFGNEYTVWDYGSCKMGDYIQRELKDRNEELRYDDDDDKNDDGTNKEIDLLDEGFDYFEAEIKSACENARSEAQNRLLMGERAHEALRSILASKEKETLADYKSITRLNRFLIVLSVILTIGMVIYVIFLMNLVGNLLPLLSGSVFEAMILIMFFINVRACKQGNKNVQQKIAELEADTNRKIKENDLHIADNKKLISDLTVTVQGMEGFKKKARLFRDDYLKDALVIQERAEKYFDCLNAEFCAVLDFRDWQNIDLIIFYFETGRADSLKEALGLVDRERQTERIVDSIARATREICKTISMASMSINNTISTCCDGLARRLDSIDANMSEQNQVLYRMVDAVNMGNALKARANETSMALYGEVLKVRTLVSQQEARRINNHES